MQKQILVAGGGIGGIAAALAAVRAGWEARVYERVPVFSEVGAGVQLGPNVVRQLQSWGLQEALQSVAAFPSHLSVRSALSGQEQARLSLGAQAIQRYGAAYATIHRADLHQLLLTAAQAHGGVQICSGTSIESYQREREAEGVVLVQTSQGQTFEGDALIGADGLWSGIRAQLLGDGAAMFTGHLAYRALISMQDVPVALRSQQVTAWLGPRLHAVHYPVRGGTLMNVVVIVEGVSPAAPQGWDYEAHATALERALKGACTPLQDLLRAVEQHAQSPWRLWPLYGRAPVAGVHQMAQGLVALLGDAAHPMLPYLAQGAGMAIEDAAQLQTSLSMHDLEVGLRLRRYALNRWQRNARVQARSRRNGAIFHARAPVRWGRDIAMRILGERLLDVPWLYRGDAREKMRFG